MMVAPAAPYTNVNAATTDITPDASFVEDQDDSGAWVTFSGLNPNTDVLVNAIADAEAHGLNPDSYELSSLEQELESFVTNSEYSTKTNADALAQQRKSLELRLDKKFARFARDLGRGVLDAQKTQKNLFRPAPKVDTEALLQQLADGEATVREILAELTPSTPDYGKLVQHMRKLLKERDSAKQRTKVRYVKSVKLGGQHASIIDLKKRLKESGDLPADSPLGILYDNELESAIKAVQSRHGITATGQMNGPTAAVLNATVDDDIEQVAMNLERWRWMPRELGDRHILINVPSYNLTMMNGDQRIVDMAVVVGSEEHNTPIFSEDAQIVEVAPTWTVPASITNNELIPIERRKPGYLESERMDFFRWSDGKLIKVPRSQVTAEDFEKKPFPYVLRQRAGKGNALGDIKILMPNKYAIYMHDTQAKKLFAKTDRAYSHGCIRLSDPFRLGGLLLQLDGKSPEETKAFLKKKETTRVRLKSKTPTHISYFTAWIDDGGKLNTRKDVYKNNKSLIAGLHAKKTLLSTLKTRASTMLAEQSDS